MNTKGFSYLIKIIVGKGRAYVKKIVERNLYCLYF